MKSYKFLKTIVRARSPLRLGLLGGGTDLSPYCDKFGGVVINSTIDKYAYVTIKEREDDYIFFCSDDLKKFDKTKTLNFSESSFNLMLHKECYKYFMDTYNCGEYIPLSIISHCEVPPGSGLGSSSTLVVTIIKAFVEYLNLGLDDYEIAKLAFYIERVGCKIQGGRQDQFAAAFGGFNLMEFLSNDRTVITPLKIKNWILCELEASLVLYFTGNSRLSSDIISDQIENFKRNTELNDNYMHDIKKQTYIFKELLLKGDFNHISESINQSWINKKKTSQKISNSKIDKIHAKAMQSGAHAGKISGAGGGGFMWFLVDPEKKIKVMNTLKEFGGYVSNCSFTSKGCAAWRI